MGDRMSHYFINDPKLEEKIESYQIKLDDTMFTFYTDQGVFSKHKLDFGSLLLIKSLSLDEKVETIIDMGSGYGPIGIFVAKKHPDKKVYMFDVNQRAIKLAQKNIEINGVKNVKATVSDLFEEVSFHADLIVTNPPIRAGKKNDF